MLAVGFSAWFLLSYEKTEGAPGHPPQAWPVASRIERSTDRATLVMLAHPRCPCTQASVDELAGVMAQAQGKARAFVLFLKPAGVADDWEKTALWKKAAGIPGVRVIADEDGLEASRFHVETSGNVLLYDAAGRLVFNGGITGSRGHVGDNVGQRSLASILDRHASARDRTFVYGCPLFASRSTAPTNPTTSPQCTENQNQ